MRKTCGFRYLHEEKKGFRMSERDYKSYLKIRNVALELALKENLSVYFDRIIKRLEELAMMSKLEHCFLFLVESLQCINTEILTSNELTTPT